MHTIHTLPNGLRILHIRRPLPIAYIGVAIDAGTRDELPDESGIAHFAEHTIFKGTANRRAWQIITRLENVGGQVDAYTTKEDTYVYSVIPTAYISRAVELISDIVLHPTFPAQELEKERVVVLDEIDSYKDSPSELIFDEFEEHLFPSDPIGRNILGSEDSLKTFDTAKMLNFVRRCYTPDRLLLFCMGDIPESTLLRLATRYFSNQCSCSVETGLAPSSSYISHAEPQSPQSEVSSSSLNSASSASSAALRDKKRPPISPFYEPFHLNVPMDTNQVHCVLGTRLKPMNDHDRYAAILLNNILGGPNMSSLLNMAIRERHGYCYTIDSSFSWYTDTAVWTLYFGCDPENYKKAYHLVLHTLEDLKTTLISPRHLATAKRQLRGQVLIGNQNLESLILAISKKVLHNEPLRPSDEILAEIDSLTADDLRTAANNLFASLSTLTYGL